MTTLSDLLAGTTPATPAPAPTFTDVARIPIVDLALPLMDFQQEAVEHALRPVQGAPYAYLALDMGLGKTPCGIAVVASSVNAGVTPALVVVPPSLRTNWVREFGKFAPWLSVATLTGTKPTALPDVDVLVIGDSTLTHWAPFLTGKIGALVVDEAHRHKNRSKRASALASIAGSVQGARVLLSGTPTPNGRHMELATQFDVLGNRAWNDIGGKGTFWGRFCPQTDSWGGRGNAEGDVLHALMTDTFMMRRRRDDVIELPNKGRSAVSMPCKGKASRDYIAAENDLIAWLSDEGRNTRGAERAEALVRLTTLRRLAGEAKVDAIVEHAKEVLENSTGGVFIVAEHKDVMDRLTMGLAKYLPVSVQGGMSDSAKQDAVDAFTSGQSRVMVGQIIAAGVGLTLHGNGLNHRVIVAQLPWTPADLRQAEDRLHRIGQTNDVEVEVSLAHIDGRWTIDERLWGMLEAKNFATGEVIDGEGDYLLADIHEGLLDSYR
jgi:SWI/SNF-related matrix-associated actin-dependent regulator 1 of chromatin subfamily A